MAMATVCNSQEPNHRCYLYTFIKNDFYCSSFFFVLVHINIESNITYTPPKHTQMRMLPKLYCFMFASRIDNVHHFVCLRNLKKKKKKIIEVMATTTAIAATLAEIRKKTK